MQDLSAMLKSSPPAIVPLSKTLKQADTFPLWIRSLSVVWSRCGIPFNFWLYWWGTFVDSNSPYGSDPTLFVFCFIVVGYKLSGVWCKRRSIGAISLCGQHRNKINCPAQAICFRGPRWCLCKFQPFNHKSEIIYISAIFKSITTVF